MKFKAAVFDLDGTVTEKGVHFPNQEMIDELVRVSKKIPIAFATGRQYELFERKDFAYLKAHIKKADQAAFFKNLFLIVENGAIGYYMNAKTGKFEKFYQSEWPAKFIGRDRLRALIEPKTKHLSDFLNFHEVSLVMHTNKTPKVETIYKNSYKILKIVEGILKKISPDFKKYLHVSTGGLGVIISPAKNDKDYGVKKIAEHLQKNRRMKFSKNLREILLVGDQFKEGGNDYYFLNGKVGTPYCVGDYESHGKYPIKVLDKRGKRLLYAPATLELLRSNFPAQIPLDKILKSYRI